MAALCKKLVCLALGRARGLCRVSKRQRWANTFGKSRQEPEGWEIPLPGACGTVALAFLWVWVRGRCSTCLETSVPSPIWPRSRWESREQTRDPYKKPQLLRKSVSGKKPFDLLRCVLPSQTSPCPSRTGQAPRRDHRADIPAGEEGAFAGSREAQGGMAGYSRVQHSGPLKKSFLQHPFNRTKQARQLGLSPGSTGDFKQRYQEIPALFPSGLRQGQGHSCPRFQSKS